VKLCLLFLSAVQMSEVHDVLRGLGGEPVKQFSDHMIAFSSSSIHFHTFFLVLIACSPFS
jgi:Ca2+-binding EF-hand superfamily protein